jgi:dephospho-CoA kinase
MRMLTERGIRLAALLRAEGLPVIESYPGAAQDIMRIPRKRAGLQYLIRGLADFGVRGDFIQEKVTHDEVDAITSALVGTFFWCGRFEALGSEDEDYLIVPDLRTARNGWHERCVVGISGAIAAGKTTAATTLRERGFAYTRYSEVLADMLREQGRQVDRRALQEIGEEVHRDPGQRWLSAQLLSRLSADAKLVVVDGLRFPEDHAFFAERYGPNFLHWHIEAPREMRKDRYLAMGFTGADFEHVTSHPVEGGILALAKLAHLRLDNSGAMRTFKSRVLEAAVPVEQRVVA